MACAAHAAEELDDAGIAAGDVGGELFEDADGAGAAAIVDGLGDVDALGRGVEATDEARGDEVADVRNDPVIAGFDGLVLPETVCVAAQLGGLRANAVDEFLQRPWRTGRGEIGRAS